jgi:RNA polymerase sigma-70 factor (ECF subfamily)
MSAVRRLGCFPASIAAFVAGTRATVSALQAGRTMLSQDDLSDLVESVASRRDRPSFVLLFKHFAPLLKGYLVRSGVVTAVAEEIVQETMLSVWRKAQSFDRSKASASTWVMTIARNLRIDYQRRDRTIAVADFSDWNEAAPDPDAETVMIGNQRDERVRAAMAKLSDEQAAIMRLTFFVEKPQSEIALALGIPLGTVKSRVRLAMARLRKLLEDVA